jgi:transcription-repair coupling factor (superfamily II helicase)
LDEYLPPDTAVVWDGAKRIADIAAALAAEYRARLSSSVTAAEAAEEEAPFTAEQLFSRLNRFKRLSFCVSAEGGGIFKPERVFGFRPVPPFRYRNAPAALVEDILRWRIGGYTVVLAARDEEGARGLEKAVADAGLTLTVKRGAVRADESGAFIVPFELESGFIFHDSKLVVIGTYELMPRRASVLRRRAGKGVFTEARVGDYVVHAVHGIGKCAGITKLSGAGAGAKDYIVVEYKGGDRLYVPAEQTGNLSRYSGGDQTPPLNRIGGAEFARLVARAKASVKKLAFDMARLYGQRGTAEGVRYSPDDELLRAFADTFPYEETDDQLRCIEEVLSDMRAGKVMDRLVCGDAGNGKTEVALRAAFKTVSEGYQVAFIAPTGILSNQHFQTCLDRFSPFGIRTECLNRFRSDKEQAATVARLAGGECDVVCGTHRILSADVRFKNLGLLILDEEQRFGVADKEKIKLLRRNVNVLSLTATPIPRTLHMSLSGIRDISVLETPPEGRLPVQTYTAAYSDALVTDAARRELARGGQVFIVFNRIDRIFAYADEVRALLPGARIAVAHGRQDERELEDAVAAFYAGSVDILISTIIIENGIDLPRANTLIVTDADKLGLAQLYQLRGRVGRSDRLAYAYFTYEEDKALTENAYKRLEAIAEFADAGSGFKIAMRDLEIRGAGEVLGARQHGHMEKVGYDMYCKLLSEAVAELSGVAVAAPADCTIESDLDAYIPAAYIEDDAGRMRLYQRIGALKTLREREDLIRELTDVYGAPGNSVLNLINSGVARAFACGAGITRAVMRRDGGRLEFDCAARVTERVLKALTEFSDRCILKTDTPPVILFRPPTLGSAYGDIMKFLIRISA